jgi:hypothetical protein
MAKKSESPVSVEQIDGMIRTIRGVSVMLDRDLPQIYGVLVSSQRSDQTKSASIS